MNIYAIVILITIIIGSALELISELLNLNNLKKGLPREFEDTFDPQTYQKSQEYSRVRTKFGFLTSAFSLTLMLGFWFFGGFNWLDGVIVELFDNTILRGLAFLGILIVANFLLSLPFSVYSTFVIEEKFGFNKTTAATYIKDLIKSGILGLTIGGALLAAILYIFEITGEQAWLYGWLTVVAISLILQYIAPTYIMPLFNKFTPLEEGSLRSAILNYAQTVKFPLTNVFVMDGSKRSSKSNAFFTGFLKNKRIVLFDTLVNNHSENEIVAILAHEIGHYKKKHIIKSMFISILHMGVLFYLLSIFLYEKGMYDAFYMADQPIYAGLVFFAMLYSPVELILSILMNIFSRSNEFQADEFAVETSKLYADMKSALKKLSKDNLSNLTPHPFYVFLNYSHPPVLSRIRNIDSLKMIDGRSKKIEEGK